jgi:chemotaxis signal transduction protein
MASYGTVDSREVYVVFLIAGKEYGIAIECVSSILNPLGDYLLSEHITIGTDSIKIGEGEIPIISFHELNNIKPSLHSQRTRIIIANSDDFKAAFYVDQIKDFISSDTKNFFNKESISVTEQPYMKWQIVYNDRYILIPDFDKILTNVKRN